MVSRMDIPKPKGTMVVALTSDETAELIQLTKEVQAAQDNLHIQKAYYNRYLNKLRLQYKTNEDRAWILKTHPAIQLSSYGGTDEPAEPTYDYKYLVR